MGSHDQVDDLAIDVFAYMPEHPDVLYEIGGILSWWFTSARIRAGLERLEQILRFSHERNPFAHNRNASMRKDLRPPHNSLSHIALAITTLALAVMQCAVGGITKVDQSSPKMSTTGTAAGDKDYSKESLFTGNAAFQVPLVQMGAVDITLQYNSNVRRQVRTDNRLAPSGWIGVGWNLTLGSIIGEIGSTADTSDDRYRYVDASGSTDIIRLASGEYVLQQYRPWKITRSIVGGLVAGWTIIKEDGTVMRFGNYRQASGSFSVSLDSTYATRCSMGFGGIVENPPAPLYSSATLVPYQWDLTEILSIGGSRTTITYQQVTAPLSIGSSTSSLSYTRESHPWKITNNQGGEVEFVLGNLNADEYDAPAQTYMQNVYEAKHLDTLAVRQNGQIVKRIVLGSFTSQDILSTGAMKRYLASIHVHNRNGARMLISQYDYCGIGAEAAGINPGAVRRISNRSGGCTEYRYKSQPLTRDTLNVTRTIPSNIPGSPGNTQPSPTGVAGTDFYIVSQSLYRFYRFGGAVDTLRPMEVYRRGVTGWYRDSSFPYDSTTFCQVGSDVVVGFFKDRWKVVRRSGEGWSVYDVDSAFTADSVSYNTNAAKRRGPVGFGSTYFVFKYNWTLVSSGDFTYSIAAVHITEKGLKVRALGSGFHETNYTASDNSVFIAPLRADCGDNFFVLTSRAAGSLSTAPMMSSYFTFRDGSWSMLAQRQAGTANPFASSAGLNFATIVPSHRIGKNFVVSTFPFNIDLDSLYVYQPSAGYLKHIDSVRIVGGAQVSVGDFYYAVGVSGSSGSTPWMKTWTGQGWEQTYLSGQFPSESTSLLSTSIFQSGRKVVFTGKHSEGDSSAHLFAITHNGSSWTASGHHILYGVQNSPRASAFGENAFLLEDRVGQEFLECHLRAVSFDGDTLRWASVVPKLHCNRDFSSGWYWQPGRNFVASFRLWNNPGGWVDTNQVLTQCLDSLGRPSFARTGYDIVIDRKTTVSGMGDSIVTTFAFENGVFDDQVSGGKYNKVTVTHPGATGKTVSYFYNDLGATYSEELSAGKNVSVLDGTPYRVKEYSNANALVRETVQFTSAEAIDSVRGVYFIALLRDSVVTDGIPRLTTYDYGNSAHRQVTRVSETNSDGTQCVIRMTYPHDYAITSPSSSDAMIRALDSMKNVSHVVNALVERWVFRKTATDSSTVLSADLSTFRSFAPGQILPSQALKLRDSAVVDFTPASSSVSAFANDPRYVADATIDCYTLQGNIQQARDANGSPTSTLWGYNNALPVASAVNARTSQGALGAECSYIGFECGTTTPALPSDEDYWSLYGANGYNVTSTDAHTGLYSQKLPGYSSAPTTSESRFGPTRDFCPPDLAGQNRKYVVTCWVKTEPGMAAGAVRLIAHTKYNSDDNTVYPAVAGAYQSTSTGDTYGEWVCLEDTINVQAIRQLGGIPDNELLRIRVFPINYDASHYMLVDDIRVFPADGAVAVSRTYDPVLLLPTSSSDAGGTHTQTGYDGFGRPTAIRDSKGQLLNEYSYYYSRDGNEGDFSALDPNFTQVIAYRASDAATTTKIHQDGLGREIQTAVFSGSDNIIAHTEYDSLGRPYRAFKPYLFGDSQHIYDAGYAQHAINYYWESLGISLGATPFAEIRYWADPLGRVKAQGAPGDLYAIGAGHDRRTSHEGNPDSLWYVTVSINEQGDTTITSANLQGKTAASEVRMRSGAPLRTRCEYDVLGQLKKSEPPNGPGFSTLYKYTTRGELRQRVSPDAGAQNLLYDANGNLRFSMDAAQTAAGRFTYRIYDKLNRVVQIGEHTPATDFTQSYADGQLPGTGNTVHLVTVYDSLVANGQHNLRGRLSRSRVYRRGALALTSVYSYDDRGRIEWLDQVATDGPAVRLLYSYDLQGNLVKKGFQDKDSTINSLWTYYEHDDLGRLCRVFTAPFDNSSSRKRVAEYEYTASGQIRTLRLGEGPAQILDYSYNERDWIKGINDVESPGSDRFAERISYSTTVSSLYASAQYNGNIAATEYFYDTGSVSDMPIHGHTAYTFDYDHANRLVSAQHYSGGDTTEYTSENAFSLPTITYDSNGNISRLIRNGDGLTGDDLSYSYGQSNRLVSVSHSGQAKSYQYDASGNVTADAFRGISSAVYNYQNLPDSAVQAQTGSIGYTYDGTGARIRKTTASKDEFYVLGADGQTEAIYNARALLFWNITANGKVIGKLIP